MKIPHLITEFCTLSPASQLESLIRLAYELTLVGRDTYEPSSLDLRHPQRLRRLNEIQHRVTSHVMALLAGDPNRYPDEVLASIILEQDEQEMREEVAAAFSRSLSLQEVA